MTEYAVALIAGIALSEIGCIVLVQSELMQDTDCELSFFGMLILTIIITPIGLCFLGIITLIWPSYSALLVVSALMMYCCVLISMLVQQERIFEGERLKYRAGSRRLKKRQSEWRAQQLMETRGLTLAANLKQRLKAKHLA